MKAITEKNAKMVPGLVKQVAVIYRFAVIYRSKWEELSHVACGIMAYVWLGYGLGVATDAMLVSLSIAVLAAGLHTGFILVGKVEFDFSADEVVL